MSDYAAVIDRYVAFWNEEDAEQRQRLLIEVFDENASYTGPLLASHGHEGIATLADEIRTHLPGYQFRRTSPIDAHHGYVRYSWEIIPADESSVLAAGIDIGLVAEDGLLESVTAFLDKAPEFAAMH